MEDDPSIMGLIRTVLEEEGYEVVPASDGVAGLDLACQHSPRLILVDMRMPRMGGWEFVHAYRELPGPHCPIVVLSGGHDTAQKAAEIAAAGCLSKPFDIEQLIAVVVANAL